MACQIYQLFNIAVPACLPPSKYFLDKSFFDMSNISTAQEQWVEGYDNWHAIREQWVEGLKWCQRSFLTRTNNRVESINQKVKSVITKFSNIVTFFKDEG